MRDEVLSLLGQVDTMVSEAAQEVKTAFAEITQRVEASDDAAERANAVRMQALREQVVASFSQIETFRTIMTGHASLARQQADQLR
ncbi:MAG: hypothetical protein ACK4TC_05520 [Sphingomonas pseudosanguinis]|uniref:hypothetical protein n=1 Tax=Sphingomonas pseudosanguinis TaxID=413712 RepID=UPI0039189F6C